jgi:putrescine transport system permease protein
VKLPDLKRFGLSGRALVAAVPQLWLALFFLIPFVIVLKIAFSDAQIAMPPYQPLFEWVGDKALHVKLNFANFAFLVEDNLYWKAYLNSIYVAGVSTLLCLLIGYPVALQLARGSERLRALRYGIVLTPLLVGIVIRSAPEL